MSCAWLGSATDIDMTSVIDGRTHVIAAADFDAGIWRGQGRYRAVCHATVVAAALASSPGPECAACRHAVQTLRADRAAAPPERRHARWIPRIVDRLRASIVSTPRP